MTIPLPRGRICILKKGSYAFTVQPHCVRNCDLTERSASLILRHVHTDVEKKAREYQTKVEQKKLEEANSDVKGESKDPNSKKADDLKDSVSQVISSESEDIQAEKSDLKPASVKHVEEREEPVRVKHVKDAE